MKDRHSLGEAECRVRIRIEIARLVCIQGVGRMPIRVSPEKMRLRRARLSAGQGQPHRGEKQPRQECRSFRGAYMNARDGFITRFFAFSKGLLKISKSTADASFLTTRPKILQQYYLAALKAYPGNYEVEDHLGELLVNQGRSVRRGDPAS